MRRSIVFLACLALSDSGPLTAQSDPAPVGAERRMTAVRTEEPIVIDGEMDESAWNLAEPATGFIQKIPQMGELATEQTQVRILYDDENIYLGVYCFDSAGAEGILVNDISKDFYTLDSDGFQVVLDTFDDNRNTFLFATNPKGGRFDMQTGADGNAGNSNWDGLWYVETRVTDRGWQAEMAIPLKTLRFREVEHQVWGINFERRVRRKFEDSYWSPIPSPYRLSRISLAGTLDGLQGLKQARNLYIKPYISAPIVRRANDDIDFMPEAGLDVKYGVSTQLTLDVTLNTDFSQVEADEEQINLTRFDLFFPEKREFFLENSSIFDWGRPQRSRTEFGRSPKPDLIPFFSRRIGIADERLVPVLGGARLTGRAGKYNIGLLSMQAAAFEEIPSTNFSVMRVRRELPNQADVGAIFVNKEGANGTFNRTYGIDSNFTFFRYLDISGYFLETDGPESGGRDEAANFEASWKDPLIEVRGRHLWIAEDFNPEVGFAPRTGMRKTSGLIKLTPRPEEGFIREFQPSLGFDYITSPDGLVETKLADLRFSMIFSDRSAISIARESTFERLDEPFEIADSRIIPIGDYGFDEYSLFYESDQSKILVGELRLSTGDFFSGQRDSYTLGVRFQPSYRFNARVLWSLNDIDLSTNLGQFKTNLVTSRFNYSFSNHMFLRALIQYNSEEGEVSSNIRFNLIHKPLSDLFVVYNERRSSSGEIVERALITKLTYMFSF
ncbi:MAG: DUF5916 domain-containing protein [Acidobacteriota bacterium]